MVQFDIKELLGRITRIMYVILYIALNGSICLAGEGTQSAEVGSVVTGVGNTVGVAKSLEKKEKGFYKVHFDTSEIDTQGQSVGDRKRPFEDVVQSEPSDDTQEPKKIPERWDDD